MKVACNQPYLGTQLDQWIDHIHLEWWAEITFHVGSASKNVQKIWIFMLGYSSQVCIIVKNLDLACW